MELHVDGADPTPRAAAARRVARTPDCASPSAAAACSSAVRCMLRSTRPTSAAPCFEQLHRRMPLGDMHMYTINSTNVNVGGALLQELC